MYYVTIMQERDRFEDLARCRGGMTFRENEVLMVSS